MKLYELYVYLNEDYIEDFLRKDYFLCLNISDRVPETVGHLRWMHIGEVDVEIDVDEKKIRQIAIERLDNEIGQKRAIASVAIQELEDRKQKLLALEYIPDNINHAIEALDDMAREMNK